MIKQVPNIFTLINLFFGCLAIALILQTDFVLIYQVVDNSGAEAHTELVAQQTPPQIWWASLFILLAAVVDVLDGAVARFFNATSELGKQLDSLSDVVSFGVAPGMIFYQFMRMALMAQSDGLEIDIAFAFPSFLLPCAAAYRLAKFNTDKSQSNVFKGVPTPMVGLFVASLPMIYWYTPTAAVQSFLLNIWALYMLVILLSVCMIIPVPMMSLKLKTIRPAANIHLILLVAVGITSAAFLGWLAAPIIFVCYIILSLIFKSKFS
jgi:CDP-diacylglycerol--serine O-phosphatidyltransferase